MNIVTGSLFDHFFGEPYHTYVAIRYGKPYFKVCDASGRVITVYHRNLQRSGKSDWLFPGLQVNKQQIVDRTGIRRNIVLVEGIFYGGVCYARSLQESDSAIGFPHALRLIDRESAGFLVNHEIKHALSDDGLMIGIASAVGGVVRTVLSGIGFYKAMSAFSFSWGGAIAVVSSLSGVFFARRICKEIIADLNRWRERKADDFAIAHASDEELKGGWRHFTVAKRVADDVDKGMCTRLPWYGTATMLVHMVCGPFETHPTLESRIRKIEKALVHRGIVLDEATEARRLEILRIYRMASLRLWHDMGKESVPEIRETRSDVYNSMIPEDLRGTHRKDSTPEEKGRAFWHCVAGLCKEDVTKDLRRTPFPEAYRTSS